MTEVIIEGVILAILIEAVILAVLAGVAYVIQKNKTKSGQNTVSLLKRDACEIMDLLEAIDKLNNSK